MKNLRIIGLMMFLATSSVFLVGMEEHESEPTVHNAEITPTPTMYQRAINYVYGQPKAISEQKMNNSNKLSSHSQEEQIKPNDQSIDLLEIDNQTLLNYYPQPSTMSNLMTNFFSLFKSAKTPEDIHQTVVSAVNSQAESSGQSIAPADKETIVTNAEDHIDNNLKSETPVQQASWYQRWISDPISKMTDAQNQAQLDVGTKIVSKQQQQQQQQIDTTVANKEILLNQLSKNNSEGQNIEFNAKTDSQIQESIQNKNNATITNEAIQEVLKGKTNFELAELLVSSPVRSTENSPMTGSHVFSQIMSNISVTTGLTSLMGRLSGKDKNTVTSAQNAAKTAISEEINSIDDNAVQVEKVQSIIGRLTSWCSSFVKAKSPEATSAKPLTEQEIQDKAQTEVKNEIGNKPETEIVDNQIISKYLQAKTSEELVSLLISSPKERAVDTPITQKQVLDVITANLKHLNSDNNTDVSNLITNRIRQIAGELKTSDTATRKTVVINLIIKEINNQIAQKLSIFSVENPHYSL